MGLIIGCIFSLQAGGPITSRGVGGGGLTVPRCISSSLLFAAP